MLEEGNKDDWFGSPFIVRLSVVAAVALALFVWIELTAEQPLLNLRLLLRRNFGLGSVGNVLLGMALYGSVYLLPQLSVADAGLQCAADRRGAGLDRSAAAGADPVRAAADAAVRCAAAGRLVGLGLFAASCFLNIDMTHDYAGDQLLVPNMVRAVGQALVMTPLSALATGGIEREKAGSASALFNMMRNLGGVDRHRAAADAADQARAVPLGGDHPRVSLFDEATRQRWPMLQQLLHGDRHSGSATAWHDAVVAVGRTIRAQSYFLAYGDTFFVMGCALLLAMVAAVLMGRDGRRRRGALTSRNPR